MTGKTREAVASREVHICFCGLFYFSFSESSKKPYKRSEGNVGIFSTRKDHDLFIRYKNAGDVSDYITIPHSVLKTLAPESIVIDKSKPVTEFDVTVRGFDGPAGSTGWGGEPANRMKKDGADKYDFKWIVDFEGPKLHNSDQSEMPGSLKPNLKFKTGDFYTAKITEDKYTFYKKGQTPKNFGYASDIQGVKISLGTGEHLVIKLGKTQIQVPDTITEIQLYNLRPKHVPDLIKKTPKPKHSSHGKASSYVVDDTQIYYTDLLCRVAEGERFHFGVIEPIYKNPPFICFGGGGSRK